MAVLGELEHRIMRVLWDSSEPLTVRQVHAALVGERALAYTTVMTVLDRLAKKGHVDRDQVGRAWIYRPAASQAHIVSAGMLAILRSPGVDSPAVLQSFADALSVDEAAVLTGSLSRPLVAE